VQVQFDVTRDASGGISSATATFYFQLTGYPAGTTIQGAHIHPAPAGTNGPVIISTGLTATNTVTLASGTGDFTFSNIPVDPALAQQILNNPAAFYFNVHSPTNPGGFSRGQLQRCQLGFMGSIGFNRFRRSCSVVQPVRGGSCAHRHLLNRTSCTQQAPAEQDLLHPLNS
jgi:hypothetical protein